jgi:signal transduction histidine kinase/DNA-binding response OmpR family regulator
MNRTPAPPFAALAVIGSLLVLIPLADALTPLGYAEWALYFLPVGATLFQPRPWLPIVVAALATVLSAIGVLTSPSGIDVELALVNRGLAAVAHCAMAGVIWRVLTHRAELERLLWLQQSETSVARALLGEQSVESVARSALRSLCEVLDAEVGAIYRLEGRELHLAGRQGTPPDALPPRLNVDDGMFGEVLRSGAPRAVMDVPPGHLDLASVLGRSAPRHLALAPVVADGAVLGLIELGFARPAGLSLERELALLAMCSEAVGVALRSALYRQRLAELLEETQRQSEELQAQQEELRVANEELEEQSRALQASQASLEGQQAELEATNVQLEEQTQRLERQKAVLLDVQGALQENAERLEAASRYKSEFLANMSHELRTPLNSALILSKLLADNREATLTAEQVRYAQAIHDANNDLLTLINDILDLSKIEAGRVELQADVLPLEALLARLRATFEPLTRQKHLVLHIEAAPGAPDSLRSDGQRLQQILTNLLANAVKFTDRGEVVLRVQGAPGGRVRFEVSDTGVGIAPQQHEVIFEAFRQADGSTSRRHGGTGLGLSISRELARRLGGDITLASEPGRGSCFTLELPLEMPEPPADGRSVAGSAQASTAAAPAPDNAVKSAPPPSTHPPSPPAAFNGAPALPRIDDDRARRRHGDRLILAVEDDAAFAQALLDLIHERDFDGVVAGTAAEAIELARELQPSGVLLDVMLPDASGLSVLERLKRDPATRHIPVHMVSALDRAHAALEMGAVGHLLKPATREGLGEAIGQIERRLRRNVRRLLIVEDDAALRENLRLLLGDAGVEITGVGTLADAKAALAELSFDCMVTDLALPDGSGYDLLEHMAAREHVAFPPVIIYTGRALTRDEEQRLRRYSRSIIVKGARSPERLLDEVTLFLHSVESALPPERQRMLRQARQRDAVLDGRRLLLAEDDVRNIFALTSVFEPLGARLEVARNGREALERLEGGDIDLVLMDVMMPEMDGLTAMRRIRERAEWRDLPVIALTAKAMPDDRERCLEAGANDYIAKPIDVDKLVSLCRVWTPK